MLTQTLLSPWQLKQAFWAREDDEIGVLETLRFIYMVLSFMTDTQDFEELQHAPEAVLEHPLYELASPLLENKELHDVLEPKDLGRQSAFEPISFSAPRETISTYMPLGGHAQQRLKCIDTLNKVSCMTSSSCLIGMQRLPSMTLQSLIVSRMGTSSVITQVSMKTTSG